ncbi:EF-hand domain pair [Artemisia annua]|uniref:EF-hand domain pair n=1 Tax=Artemisia annua TaxID=35608 RepID=A0A2U1PEH1_ARTAN|nr:EF-hand domain pair [Artemisia annua]
MKSFQVIALTLSMLMIISMVKGRWLDLETYSTSVISVGVHNISNENPPNLRLEISNSSTLYAEQRCKSLYGFFPCADTMLESVCLMFMYMYFMILGDEWTRKGSKVLFQWIGDKKFGESLFRVLKALPRIAVFVVPGVLSSASDAQNQVVFGVSMYAGSTVITLTLIWGIRIILSRFKLKQISSRESDHQQDSTKNRSSLKDKLPFETDKDFTIDKETGDMAVNMLLSLIPFTFVGLLHFINTTAMTLFALIVSAVSLILYWVYQVAHPMIRFRSLAYLKQENLRARFFYHVMRLAVFEDLVDKQGDFSFKRIFEEVDKEKKDDHISNKELDDMVEKMFMLKEDGISKKKDNISKEYAKAEMLKHFDRNRDKKISWDEFEKGYTSWLEEAASSGCMLRLVNDNLVIHWQLVNFSQTLILDLQVKEKAMMPKIIKQVHEKHGLVKEDGEPDREKIKGEDLEELIKNLDFRIKLDHNKVLDELLKEFDVDKNQSVERKEFVDGFIKWIEKTRDPKKAIEKFEEDNWGKIQALLKPDKPKATIMYAIFGILITIAIASPFIRSVRQFSTTAHIPFVFTSFVMVPIAMKAKMVIVALLNAQDHVRKNASLTFSEIYDQLVMDNLIGFVSLLLVVYIRGLSWTYSAEVLAIMIPCAIVGVFAIKRDTYPLWASILAILLYPVSIYIYYVLPNAS